jgi:hypothetical protein
MTTKTICDSCGKAINKRSEVFEIEINRFVNSDPDDREYVESFGEFCEDCKNKVKQCVLKFIVKEKQGEKP